MRYTVDRTDKILYNGSNAREVIDFFRKWEKEWGFDSGLFNDYISSYRGYKKGIEISNLVVNHTSGLPTYYQSVICYNNWLSYHKLNDGEIILVIG